MSDTKRTGFAYFFALIGGLFGLHHLYLGRTQHALLWFTTFGGFGIGLVYELFFSLRKYVREVNNDNSILDQYQQKMREQKSPAFELTRFCGRRKINSRIFSYLFSKGQFVVAIFYGFITYYAFPDTWVEKSFPALLISCCSALAIAFGREIESK